MEMSFENVVLEVDAVYGYPERKETAEKVYSSYFYKSYISNHTRKAQLSRCASTIISSVILLITKIGTIPCQQFQIFIWGKYIGVYSSKCICTLCGKYVH